MHPALTQALAAERVRDMLTRAAARDLARSVRRNRRTRISLSHAPALSVVGPITRAPHPAVPQAGASARADAPSAVGTGSNGATSAHAA